MGKKRTADERRRYAEQNGFKDNDTDIDDNPVPRSVLGYTKERYNVQMQLWHEYRSTHPDADVHDLKTLKHFAKFMANSTQGMLDPNRKPTVQTVRNYFRCFVSGWNIDNPASRISRDLTDSITNYIIGPLQRELSLSTAIRGKTYLTLENYMHMETLLWQNDGYEYVHEAYRVFISAKLKLHVYTPARIGEISESTTRRGTEKGLRYKDTIMLVAWNNGQPELRYSLKREFAKGMHDKEAQRPIHLLYEFLPNQPLVVQPLVFMLAIFLAAKAFKKYSTLEQVLAVMPSTDGNYWELEWADNILDQPVFPTVTKDGPTQEIQNASSFSAQVREVSLRAGMINPVTIHASRRETLIGAIKNYPKDEVMKYAAHTNQTTLTRDYLSAITVVDGQATFLKMPLRSDQAEDFRSMTVKRNPESFLSLPAKAQDELRQRSDYVAITKKIEEISAEIIEAVSLAQIAELKSRRSQLIEERRILENKELKKVRSTQNRIHLSERKGIFHLDQHRSQFSRICHMMEERQRLSNMLFCIAPLRSAEGMAVVKDLIALITNTCRVAYQPSLQPTNGSCPYCPENLEQVAVDRRWQHVFDCSMAHHKKTHKFVEFCFVCNSFVGGDRAWKSHCQEHIDRHETPLRCNFLRFRHAIACPGRCLVCMHNKQLPAVRRMYGYKKQSSWKVHIHECFAAYIEGLRSMKTIPCPNPDCSHGSGSEQELWFHLQDAHSYPPRDTKAKSEEERDIFVGQGNEYPQAKRRRIYSGQDSGKPGLTEASELEDKCIWTTPASPNGPESTASSSDTRAPLSSGFDVDASQERYLSVSSISSLSCGDEENLGIVTYGIPSGSASLLDCDINAQDGIGNNLSLETIASNPIYDSVSQVSLEEKGWTDERPPNTLSLYDVSTDVVDPRLRDPMPLDQDMTDMVAEPLTGSYGNGDNQEPPQVAPINEKENIWPAEALLARWKQGRRIFYLVKWVGFGDEHNTWEKRTDVSSELADKFDAEYTNYGGNHIGVELLQKRIRHRKVEYLVHWKGRPATENSWENESTISPERIREFDNSKT